MGLDYNSFKRRVMAAGHALPGPAVPLPSSSYVGPGGRVAAAECIVELERPGGAQLRVELRISALPDLAELALRFATEEA